MRTIGNRVRRKSLRGFKSLSLRKKRKPANAGFFAEGEGFEREGGRGKGTFPVEENSGALETVGDFIFLRME